MTGPDRAAALAALAGRAAEAAELAGAVADLLAGRGRTVLITGEPGIGKSALLASVLDQADLSRAQVFRAEWDDLGRRFPLSALLGALGVEPGSPDPDRARAARALAPDGPAAGSRVPMAAEDAAGIAGGIVAELVDRLCARRPVLLVAENLQWADEASVLLWSRLSRSAAQSPLLLVGLRRPAPARPDLDALARSAAGAPHGAVIALGPLAGPPVLDLAERLTGHRPGPGLAGLLASAGGNPLYVREIVDAAVRSGAVRAAGGVLDLDPAQRPDPPGRHPASLSQAVTDRLDFLSTECRDVLLVGALHGLEFTEADLADLVEPGPDRAGPLLDEAVAAGVLDRAGGRFRFRHGLIRQALYESMPEALRAALHQDRARRLIRSGAPLEHTAEAVLRALPAADGWELPWLAGHAEPLAFRAPLVAAELLGHALADARPAGPDRAAFEYWLAVALFVAGRHEEAEQAARRVLAGADGTGRRGQAAWLLGRIHLRSARYDEALEAIAAGDDDRCDRLWRARLAALRSVVLGRTGPREAAAAAARAAAAEGERLGDPVAAGFALHSLAMIDIGEGDLAGALVYIDRALAWTAGDIRCADLRMTLLGNRAGILDNHDRHEEALAGLRLAGSLAERSGTGRVGTFQVHAGILAFNRGLWDDALAEFDAAESADGFEDLAFLYFHGHSALIAAHRDDEPAARGHLRRLDERVAASRWAAGLGFALLARALLAERDGRPRDAADALLPLIDPGHAQLYDTVDDLLPALVRFALAAGDRDGARRAADIIAAALRRRHRPNTEALARWCLGQVECDAAPILRAADYFRSAHRVLELGTALEDAAALLAASGEPDAARAALAESLAAYRTLGAAWDARRARARLRPHGVLPGVRGPRHRPRSGWAALTATEEQVAGLVAQGLSNPDIAERLLLSRRTVQTHVSHILAKLAVRSRREIAELARAEQAAR